MYQSEFLILIFSLIKINLPSSIPALAIIPILFILQTPHFRFHHRLLLYNCLFLIFFIISSYFNPILHHPHIHLASNQALNPHHSFHHHLTILPHRHLRLKMNKKLEKLNEKYLFDESNLL